MSKLREYFGTLNAGQVTRTATIPLGLELRTNDDEGFTKVTFKNQEKKTNKHHKEMQSHFIFIFDEKEILLLNQVQYSNTICLGRPKRDICKHARFK